MLDRVQLKYLLEKLHVKAYEKREQSHEERAWTDAQLASALHNFVMTELARASVERTAALMYANGPPETRARWQNVLSTLGEGSRSALSATLPLAALGVSLTTGVISANASVITGVTRPALDLLKAMTPAFYQLTTFATKVAGQIAPAPELAGRLTTSVLAGLTTLTAPASTVLAGLSAPLFLVSALVGLEQASNLGVSSLMGYHHSATRASLQKVSDFLSVNGGRGIAAASLLAALGLAGRYVDKSTATPKADLRQRATAKHRHDQALLHGMLEDAARGSRSPDADLYAKIKAACKQQSWLGCTHRFVRTNGAHLLWPCEKKQGRCRVQPEVKLQYKPNRRADASSQSSTPGADKPSREPSREPSRDSAEHADRLKRDAEKSTRDSRSTQESPRGHAEQSTRDSRPTRVSMLHGGKSGRRHEQRDQNELPCQEKTRLGL